MATTNSPTQQYPVNQVFNYTYDTASDTWLPSVASGASAPGQPTSNVQTIGGQVQNTPLAAGANGQSEPVQMTGFGSFYFTQITSLGIALAYQGTNADGVSVSGANSRQQIASIPYVFNGASHDRVKKPNLTSRLLSAAASVNATLVKNAPGDLFYLSGFNSSASPRWLKLYNKATAPTVGTDTPIWTEYLAPQSKFAITFDGQPLYFSAGIGYGLTTASPDADTSALTAADIQGMNIAYA